MATAAEMLVTVTGLRKSYGSFEALSDLSFALQTGSSTGLLGPNGAGKSTLLKCLLGFLPFTADGVELLGHSPVSTPLAVRQRVGYMPENETWFPGATGLEAVVLAGRLAGMPKEPAFSRSYEVLDFLGMDEVRHRPVEGYSVGLKQKIKLAQAVIHGPQLLFLDEPLSGLDPNSRDEMMGVLRTISAKGVAMVISSHILKDLEALCQDVLVLDRGRLLFAGTMAALQRRERNHFMVRVKGDAERLADGLRQHGARVTVEHIRLDVTLPDEADARLIWQTAKASDTQVRELRPATDSLEKAFLRLLGREEE